MPFVLILLAPVLLFILFHLDPARPLVNGMLRWYYGVQLHYYATYLLSFMAFIAAFSAGVMFEVRTKLRATFIAFAFGAIAGMSLLSSFASPGIILPTTTNLAFIWSSRLSILAGAAFFALAGIRWRPALRARLLAYRRVLLAVSVGLYVAYAFMALGNPALLRSLNQYEPYTTYALSLIAISLLLWAARRSWQLYRQEGSQTEKRLALSLLLLAEAQAFLALSLGGSIGWWFYQLLALAAFVVAITAVLVPLETTRHLQPARYFLAVGSILIVIISFLSGELSLRWLIPGVDRLTVVSLALGQGILGFLVLYVIVRRLDTLIAERSRSLEQEQRHRNELTQLIIHDLKSPLTVIMGGLNLLAKGNLGPLTETQTQLMTQLEQSVQDILRMSNDLLDVERLEADALPLKRTRMDPVALLRERVTELQIVANTHKQRLTLVLPGELPIIQADKELMRRVINNLLANAFKFTPEEGQIEVSASKNGNTLMIDVADSGPGVPPAEREHIFEKFGQVKGTERRGAGLGLTFCKMVIEAHSGTLTVGDSSLGGALFQIRLPLPPLADVDVHDVV